MLSSRDFDIRAKFTRCRRAVILPLILLGMALGQANSAGTMEDAPVQFVSTFSSDADVRPIRTSCQHLRDMVDRSGKATAASSGERNAVCDQVLDILAGKANAVPADFAMPIQAEKVAVDSGLRVLITEPRTRTVHILDFANRKYSRIDVAKGDRMTSPYAIAVDANDNIYVTDLARGWIAVYSMDGRFKKFLGKLKKDEGLFDRPQSIAIDRTTGRIYVADTTRNFVIILDLNGKVLAEVGKRGGGSGPAEFMEPVEVAIYKGEVFVLDRRNHRIQVLDLDGHFRRQFQLGGSGVGEATGMAFDTHGRLYVPAFNWVEVFNGEGHKLFRFGQRGEKPGEFATPRGLCTDSKDRVYVTDSGNHRIQVFQVTDQPKSKTEASR